MQNIFVKTLQFLSPLFTIHTLLIQSLDSLTNILMCVLIVMRLSHAFYCLENHKTCSFFVYALVEKLNNNKINLICSLPFKRMSTPTHVYTHNTPKQQNQIDYQNLLEYTTCYGVCHNIHHFKINEVLDTHNCVCTL